MVRIIKQFLVVLIFVISIIITISTFWYFTRIEFFNFVKEEIHSLKDISSLWSIFCLNFSILINMFLTSFIFQEKEMKKTMEELTRTYYISFFGGILLGVICSLISQLLKNDFMYGLYFGMIIGHIIFIIIPLIFKKVRKGLESLMLKK